MSNRILSEACRSHTKAQTPAVANGVLQTAIADEFDTVCAQDAMTDIVLIQDSLVLDFGSQFVRMDDSTCAR